MGYYTGADVKVWIQTEHGSDGISIDTADENLQVEANSGDGSYNDDELYCRSLIGKTGWNTPDITGVDLTIGAQDEDISYFGTKTIGKSEVKSDCTVVITKKKDSKLFATLAQGQTQATDSYGSGGHAGRHGLIYDSANTKMTISDGTVDPKSTRAADDSVCYGYRVAIQLKAESVSKDGTVLVLRNCTLGEYTTTISNDSANEETIEFSSMVSPLVLNATKDGVKFDAANGETQVTDM